MAASDAGEEAAWTKINGSSVHAHTDMYLCIVARNHSWIHINCVARFYITAKDPYETVAWTAGYRFAYSVTRGSKVLQPKTAGLIRYKFLPIILFYFIFFPKCHEYTNMTTHGVQCTRNETCDKDKLWCLQFVFDITGWLRMFYAKKTYYIFVILIRL